MNLEDTVWLMIGISGRERGRLKLDRQRFSFTGEKGTRFDVPLNEIREVSFPWHYFGGGMKVTLPHDNYRISFIEPHNHDAGIGDARDTGKKWKSALSAVTDKAI